MKMSTFVVNYHNYWKNVFRLGYFLCSSKYTASCNDYGSCSADDFSLHWKWVVIMRMFVVTYQN
jgi:hypothetical protein